MAVRINFCAGWTIEQAIAELIKNARVFNTTVVANFNDIDIFAEPGSSDKDLARYYRRVREMRDYMEEYGLDTAKFLSAEPYK